MTQTLYLNPKAKGDIERAAQMLRDGRLVAFPTETVYGLGANAQDASAVQNVYRIKRRPANNPLIVHVATTPHAADLFDFAGSEFASEFRERFELLSRHFWPGPLTIVGKKSKAVSDAVTGGLNKVAARIPSHPVAQSLLKLSECPVAAPSANLFTRPSPTSHEHVALNFGEQIDAIVDGGQTDFGIESTVIDIDASLPKVLRHGVISVAEIARVLENVTMNPIGALKSTGDASPGLCLRHYAPNIARVELADTGDIAKKWFSASALILRAQSEAFFTAQLGKRPKQAGPTCTLPDDPKGFARELFVAFYEMEAQKPQSLMVENLLSLAADPEWASVCDKLIRATTAA